MKKTIFSLMIGAIVALASCSKTDDAPTQPQSGEQLATFNVEAPAVSRTTVSDLTRYIVEAYEGNDLTTPPIRVEKATGSLTISLKKNIEYTFVFWADKGTANVNTGYWNTADLKAVAVSTGKESTVGEAAYCLAVSFNSNDFETNKSVTLKNATAQVNFVEAAGLTAADNSLTVKYSSGSELNVATGKITEVMGELERTYSNIAPVAKDDIVATDYILAPSGEKRLVDLTLTLNDEPEKSITAVPFQQNYKTNIKGEYSNMYTSVFTINDEVEDYIENDMELLPVKVGDFYMKDGTWLPGATTLTATQQSDCIGIVYWTGDPTKNDEALREAHPSCTHGLVVALKESGTSTWQTKESDVNAWINENTTYEAIFSGTTLTDPINKIVGYNNTKALEAYNAANIGNKVEVIDKVLAYRMAVPTPMGNSGWFLPSIKELTLLCGLDNQDDNVYNDSYGSDNRNATDIQLAKINNANQITNSNYWASTDYVDNSVWLIRFSKAIITAKSRKESANVRVVSAF